MTEMTEEKEIVEENIRKYNRRRLLILLNAGLLLTGITVGSVYLNKKNNPVIGKVVSEKEVEQNIMFDFYADVYGLNRKLVYDIISSSKYDEEIVSELEILLFVRNIYNNPNIYGYEYSDILTGKIYQSELSVESQISDISEVVGVDKTLNYSIMFYETSNFESEGFLKYNNPTNLMSDGKIMIFPSIYAGLIEQSLIILQHNLEGRYTIEEIANNTDDIFDKEAWINGINYVTEAVYKIGESIFSYDYIGKASEINDYLNEKYKLNEATGQLKDYVVDQFDTFGEIITRFVEDEEEVNQNSSKR